MNEATLAGAGIPFELVAGNISLDFINTLDNRPSGDPKELLRNYVDLVRFAERGGMVSSRRAGELRERAQDAPRDAGEALRRARTLREALHDIFSARLKKQNAPTSAVETLNSELRDAARHLRLVQPHKALYEWRFDHVATPLVAILWPIARAAADLLTSPDLAMVRACSSPTCQWLFLDTSKNHRRRWCSMKLCGNRAKVRKFYAKKKTS